MRRLTVMTASALIAVGVAVASATPTAGGSEKVPRCGKMGSPNGRQGVYIVKGHVSCGAAKKHFRWAAEGRGRQLPTSVAVYRRWVCGGHMGYYYCEFPWKRLKAGKPPRKSVYARSCSLPGCPRSIPRDS